MGVRKGSHGSGTWHTPGGHQEMGEPFEVTYVRELQEETGIIVDKADVYHLATTSDVFSQDKHYVTVHMMAEWDGEQEAQLMEPHKCTGWHWKLIQDVPQLQPLFAPLINVFRLPSFAPPIGSRLKRLSRHTRGKVIFLIGYPGSGKGTQGKILSQQLGLEHISTGELFRAEVKAESEIGQIFDSFMQKGQIIPKEHTFDYLRREFSRAKYEDGFLLDGYPKDLECLDFILSLLKELDMEPIGALYFKLSRDKVTERLNGRLFCPVCEMNFHKTLCPPVHEGACDACLGTLRPRKDDSSSTIEKRLDSYDQHTMPVLDRFRQLNMVITIPAHLSPQQVNRALLCELEERCCPPRSSHYMSKPTQAERSTKWHNHIDAESDLVLRRIVGQIQDACPDAQQKIYPISHLLLGPQTRSRVFESVYRRLPNFHPIHEADDEAFTTGKMGEFGLDYGLTRVTLETASLYVGRRVMTEIEEDLFEMSYDVDGMYPSSDNKKRIVRDDGEGKQELDWDQLPGWKDKQIDNVPSFELHHAVDIPKLKGERRPPLLLKDLMDAFKATASSPSTPTSSPHVGGWFIFEKKDRWAYRSNEFSNADYGTNREALENQALEIRRVTRQLLKGSPVTRSFTTSCSLERVHAMWRF